MSLINTTPSRLRVLWRIGGRLIWIASIVGAFVLMFWVFWTGLSEIGSWQLNVDAWMFVCSMIARSIALLLNVYLWSRILTSSGGTASFLKNFVLYCYTNLVKRLPTPVWLVTGRAHLYESVGTHAVITSLSTGIEAVVAMTSGFITILIFMPITILDMPTEMKVLSAISAISIWIVLSEPRLFLGISRILNRAFKRDFMFHRIRRRDLLFWNFIHTISWITGGVMMYFVIGILIPVSTSILPSVIWAWAVSGMLGLLRFLMPFLFAAREISLAFLLSALLPMPLLYSGTASVLSRLCLIVGDLLWAGVAVFVNRRVT